MVDIVILGTFDLTNSKSLLQFGKLLVYRWQDYSGDSVEEEDKTPVVNAKVNTLLVSKAFPHNNIP